MLRRVEAFVAIAEEKSFTAAANRMRVPQPWLSVQLRLLEEAFGLQLFQRSTRKVELTADGERLLSIAKRMVRDKADLLDAAAACRARTFISLNLGIEPVSYPEKNRIIADFVSGNPGIAVNFTNAYPNDLFDGLHKGDLDAILAPLPVPDFPVDVQVIRSYETSLIVPRSHEFAEFDPIPIAMLRGKQILSKQASYHLPRSLEIQNVMRSMGVEFVNAPDLDYNMRLCMVRELNIPSFWVSPYYETPEDMIVRRIEGRPLVHRLAFLRLPGRSNKAMKKLWDYVATIAEKKNLH